jgi:hypothetical protein
VAISSSSIGDIPLLKILSLLLLLRRQRYDEITITTTPTTDKTVLKVMTRVRSFVPPFSVLVWPMVPEEEVSEGEIAVNVSVWELPVSNGTTVVTEDSTDVTGRCEYPEKVKPGRGTTVEEEMFKVVERLEPVECIGGTTGVISSAESELVVTLAVKRVVKGTGRTGVGPGASSGGVSDVAFPGFSANITSAEFLLAGADPSPAFSDVVDPMVHSQCLQKAE